jgi:uncharacterized protein (TIGR02246 family)
MASVETTQSEAAIRGLLDARVQAIRAKDADALLSVQAPDLVTFNLAPPLQTTGVDRESVAEWFSWYRGPIDCEIRDLQIRAGDGVAYCHYLYRIRGTRTDGEAVDMWVRATLGFEKRDGQWRITHEHHSEPFDMQTFQALLDLTP